MRVYLKYWRVSIMLTVVLMTFFGTKTAFAANPNPGVLPLQSHPHGHTYGEWSNAWWQWVSSIPTPDNPLNPDSVTGATDCSTHQSGSIWFLAGTQGGSAKRSCTIPPGKALLLPLVNVMATNLCPTTTFDVKTLHRQANDFIDSVIKNTLEAKVDGVELQNLENYRVDTDNSFFSITLPSDNIICPGAVGIQTPQVSAGYYLMLTPLPPGTHTISMGGQAKGTSLAPPLSTEVEYTLTVRNDEHR